MGLTTVSEFNPILTFLPHQPANFNTPAGPPKDECEGSVGGKVQLLKSMLKGEQTSVLRMEGSVGMAARGASCLAVARRTWAVWSGGMVTWSPSPVNAICLGCRNWGSVYC